MKTKFVFRYAWSELELNKFFLQSLFVKDGALDWIVLKKNQFILSPLGYSDQAFFSRGEHLSFDHYPLAMHQ